MLRFIYNLLFDKQLENFNEIVSLYTFDLVFLNDLKVKLTSLSDVFSILTSKCIIIVQFFLNLEMTRYFNKVVLLSFLIQKDIFEKYIRGSW